MVDSLAVTLTGHALSGIVVLLVAIFVLYKNPKKPLNILFALMTIATFGFEAGFVLAPLMATYEAAYAVWMFNLVDAYITVAVVHFILEAVGEVKKFKWYLYATYAAAALIIVSGILFPHLFLPAIEPKLYFPYYLDGGPLYIVMLIFFLVAPVFPMARLITAYLRGKDHTRYEYFILMFILSYTFGILNFPLVFDYPIDPVFGMFVGVAIFPIAYGIVADQLLDIRIVIKRALLYSLAIGGIAGLLMLLILLNDFVIAQFPWVEFWTIPIFTALVGFVIGRIFWIKLTENDRLKYEFVTIATHKLRTPLTQMSWALKQLLEKNLEATSRALVERAHSANIRLIELTNILFETTEEKTQEYAYQKEQVPLLSLTHKTLEKLQPQIERKKLRINVHADEEVLALADLRRITAVVEVFLENAVNYTPSGGLVQIFTYEKDKKAVFAIRDTGIGVASGERRHIFSRFYRTDAAKRADTEGVGLGLAMARSIIRKHHGEIGVDSEGEGKGSVFWFSLPMS